MISGIGPDASEKHFGSSGRVQEGISGRPGAVRGGGLPGLGGARGLPEGEIREPKWIQNRSKNEDENEDEKKALLGASWVDFGTFWALSWSQKSSKSIRICSI